MNRRYDDYIRLLEEKDMNNKEAYTSVINITQRMQYQIQLLRYYSDGSSSNNIQPPSSNKNYITQLPTSSTEATIIELYDDKGKQELFEVENNEDEAFVQENKTDGIRMKKALPSEPRISSLAPSSTINPPSTKRLTRSKKPLPSMPLTGSAVDHSTRQYQGDFYACSTTVSLATTSSAIPATTTNATASIAPTNFIHPPRSIAPSSSTYTINQHSAVMMIHTQKKRKKQYLGLFFTESYQIDNYIITRKKLGPHLYRAYHHLTGQPKVVLKLILIVIDPYTFHIAYNTQQSRRQQQNPNIPIDEEIPLLVPDEQIKATILEWISYNRNSFIENYSESATDTIIFRENNKIYVIY
ncbi:hypothetical protein BDF20DRAFT_864776 [Mycotypha africana]|uniref:uncharacterized protein n=1 Tax=Mycotypha africana TaxID=64632 RepID=UPI002301253A|nr:uncharacterized protein BDF20DRAFT_864776 [Mycotypha africana]KAI8982063.1 hypothetical protein BDF20DRAFT_864776 [Mycotypha africana]